MKKYLDYYSYIQSPQWKSNRQRADDKCCLACGKEQGIFHIHHKTYERLGREIKDDIVKMCAECHKNLHEQFILFLEKKNRNILKKSKKHGFHFTGLDKKTWLRKFTIRFLKSNQDKKGLRGLRN